MIIRHSLSLILVATAAGAAAAPPRPALEKPNLVIILLDDSGYADFSHSGHPTIETPAVSRLAREGLNFTQFYSASPACTASRYGLLTGRYPRRSGMRWVIPPDDPRHLHPQETTLAEGLKARGYATAMFGKWHLGTPNPANHHTPDALPLAHGFDSWFGTDVSHDHEDGRLIQSDPQGKNPAPGYTLLRSNIGIPGNDERYVDLTGSYRDRAAAFIRANKDRPFFAYVALNMPHLQIAVSPAFEGISERGLFGDTMAEIDNLVGTIRTTLEEEGIAGNTLVVFTSDNGHWIRYQDTANHPKYREARILIGSARPFRDGKGSTWEGGVRVPGVFWWPGVIQPRSVSREPASSLDILPTVFALAGQPLPTDRALDGRDIRPFFNPVLFPGTVPDFEFIYTGFDHNPVYAVRKGPWKLHTHLFSQTGSSWGFAANSNGRVTLPRPLLFQVEKDPSERFDLRARQPDVVAQLEAVIDTFNASHTAEGTFWD
jgi:arylsulfatase A